MAALYKSRGYQTKAVNVARLSSRRSSAADRQSVKRDYLLVLVLQKAMAAQMAAMRVRRYVKTDIKIPADVRKRASATTLRVMQEGGVGRWKDIHRIIYVWYPFAKRVRSTVYIVRPCRVAG